MHRFAEDAAGRVIHSLDDINGDGLADAVMGGGTGAEFEIYLGRPKLYWSRASPISALRQPSTLTWSGASWATWMATASQTSCSVRS